MAKKTTKKTKYVEHSLLNFPAPMQKKIDAILEKVEKSEAGLMDLSKVALRVLKQAKEISQTLGKKVVAQAGGPKRASKKTEKKSTVKKVSKRKK